MGQLAYKLCGLSDLDELTRIAFETFFGTFAKDNEPDNIKSYVEKAFSKPNIEKELLTPGGEFYFALDGEEVVGYFKINHPGAQTDLNDGSSMELERIYVLEKFQNNGFGKEILNKAIEMSKTSNMDYLWLGVWEKNIAAIRFYTRHGFIKFDEHPFYMGYELQTDHLMKIAL